MKTRAIAVFWVISGFTSMPAPDYKVSEKRVLPPPGIEDKREVTYEEVKGLSHRVRKGDREDTVRKALGDPAIVSTDDDKQLMWIYTETSRVGKHDCERIKWKLVFKRGRLNRWQEPEEATYAGECAGESDR